MEINAKGHVFEVKQLWTPMAKVLTLKYNSSGHQSLKCSFWSKTALETNTKCAVFEVKQLLKPIQNVLSLR